MLLELCMGIVQLVSGSVGIGSRTSQERGQGLVEYALVLVLVAVVVIAILTLLGPQIGNVFSKIMCGLNTSCS